MKLLLCFFPTVAAAVLCVQAADLAGCQLLVTSVRTGDTEIEPLRFQMAIDGSRASWKPLAQRAQSATD